MPDQRPGGVPEAIAEILSRMVAAGADAGPGAVFDPAPWLDPAADPIAQMTAAFLVVAVGGGHPDHARATHALATPDPGPAADVAAFYRDGLRRMQAEWQRASSDGPLATRLGLAADALAAAVSRDAAREATWRAWFPQGVGIIGDEEAGIARLRRARTVTISALAPDPIADPRREVLFTSNVLLTVPAASTDVEGLPYPADLRAAIVTASAEPQRYWFDHPIQIGVEPASNELLYGLQQLDASIDAEPGAGRVTCLLSVSVTHDGLGPVAEPYVEAELARAGGLRHLDVVAVTEGDARRLVDEVVVPSLALARGTAAAAAARDGLRTVIGVDGEYGRHYSFLKAVAAFWHVALDRAVRATFKIDLDQVFAQDALIEQTGRTAFGHLTTPLWGAHAIDADGRPIHLGMLAGALVNERDVDRGLFTPDVALPTRAPILDEVVFFSALPQAISTRAEMMERYDGPEIDGVERALERVHVTGGTNGIRVDALRRHRPFTPSFVGRAEDQAYILSDLGQHGPRLAYAHATGLIMRHDKEAFAGDAIAAAHVGKLIGDDVRILVFSAYADAAAGEGTDGSLDRAAIGRLLDPFTGAFVSELPATVVLLRFALRTMRLFAGGEVDHAREYAIDGALRLGDAFASTEDREAFAARVAAERRAWADYYDALDALEAGLEAGDPSAGAIAARAVAIIDACRIKTPHVTAG